MRRNRTTLWALAACAAAVLVLVATGCGGGGGSSSKKKSGGGSGMKIGLVTDIGGLNDRSFNHLAYVGLQRAQSQLGVQGRVLQSNSNSDYIPNLSTLASQHYNLVIGVGFLMADAMDAVATKYPNVHFAIVDYPQEALKHKPPNVEGLLFKEQEAGYLVGYLSGLLEKQKLAGAGKADTIGSVGGQKIPPVDHYIAGYQAGAKKADPSIKTLNAYSQSFTDQAKCKQLALNQIAAGSDIEFQVAGGCGLGVLDAAREKNVWGIGVDADQAYIGSQVLSSALKKVDVAVYTAIKQVKDGNFKGGTDYISDVANGGIGIGKVSSKVPKSIVDQVNTVKSDIASGKIKNIPDTVK